MPKQKLTFEELQKVRSDGGKKAQAVLRAKGYKGPGRPPKAEKGEWKTASIRKEDYEIFRDTAFAMRKTMVDMFHVLAQIMQKTKDINQIFKAEAEQEKKASAK